MKLLKKEWRYRPVDDALGRRLAQELGVPPAIASILIQRGMKSASDIHDFFNPTLSQLPEPFSMKDMRQAAALLHEALVHKKPVIIYGDYDVDGTTGTALLAVFLRQLGLKVTCFQPHRLRHGYGLREESIEELREQVRGDGEPLMITVDCGISDVREAEFAKRLGWTLIITDHHQPSDKLPAADAILNPLQPECGFPYKALAGVGVAFYLAMGLRSYLAEQGFWHDDDIPNLKQFLDFVAVGTVADMVPLTGVNRIFVKAGLEILAAGARPGLRCLLEQAGIDRHCITAADIAYQIGPRINAAGRLGDPGRALDLLITTDQAQARKLAALLNEENNSRKVLANELFGIAQTLSEKALAQGNTAIVLAGKDWHSGVIGIVAARIMKHYHRPTVLLSVAEGLAKGSGRTIDGHNIYTTLQQCEDLLEEYGGHQNAAGLSLREENIEDFISRFEAETARQLGKNELVPAIWIDQRVAGEIFINDDFLHYYKKIEPFGKGNPEPVFSCISPLKAPRIVGGSHLQFQWDHNGRAFKGIGFGFGKIFAELEKQQPLEIAFTIRQDTFMGKASWQMCVSDFKRPSP